MLQTMMTSVGSIAGIATVTLIGVLIEALLRQQLPLKDFSSFLLEAVVLTLALPVLLCSTQRHLVSLNRYPTHKKCFLQDDEVTCTRNIICVAEHDIGCDVIAESNMHGVVNIQDDVHSQKLQEADDAFANPEFNESICDVLAADDMLAGRESSDSICHVPSADDMFAGSCVLPNDMSESICSMHPVHNMFQVVPVQAEQDNIHSEKLHTAAKGQIQSYIQQEVIAHPPDVRTNSGQLACAGHVNESDEHTLSKEPEVCHFPVDPMSVKMMQTGPSHFLLQVFREAATANGVREKYLHTQEGPSVVLKRALTQTRISCEQCESQKLVDFGDSSPKSTTASSEDLAADLAAEEEFDIEIEPEECGIQEDFEDEEADRQEDLYRALLRDFGVPCEQCEDDEEEDEDDTYQEEDQKLEDNEDATHQVQDQEMEDGEDAEYRAFLEEMGVPSNWIEDRDDEEEEWLTEEEEEV